MGTENQRTVGLLNPSGFTVNSYGTMTDTPLIKMENCVSGNKISVARRFFILLTVFDFLFTSLLWIICTVTSNYTSLAGAFEKEVVHYEIKSSAFDIVVIAAIRSFLILLFYALLRISHWWVISVTTAGSGIFIVAKVLLYDWSSPSSKTASVVLILYSFVISWVEAWFLDCRVVPNEAKHFSFLNKKDPEQAPIVPHSALSRSQSDDGSAFYSPHGSDDEVEKEHDGSTVSEVEWLSPKNSSAANGHPSNDDYRAIAEDALDSALQVVNSDGWVMEKCQDKDVIYSKNLPPYGKVYKFVGLINSPAPKIVDELHYKASDVHKWNPAVKKFQIIQPIDDHTDVTYTIASESSTGIIASRDFINVRIWKKQAANYVMGLVGTTHPNFPVDSSNYVRGEHGPSVYVLSPVKGNSNACAMAWLLNVNLKGWIPQYLVDQAMVTVISDYIKALRKQLSSSKEQT